MCFVDSTNGWFAADANETGFWVPPYWLPCGIPGQFTNCIAVKTFDTNTIYVLSRGITYFWKTTDGGAHWTKSGFQGIDVYAMFFMNKDTGVVVGDAGAIFRTTNAGTSWTLLPRTNTYPQYRTVFISNNGFGIATYQDGYFAKTTDYGATWSFANMSINNSWITSTAIFGSNIIISGGSSSYSYFIARSSDSGNSWAQISLNSTTNGCLYDVVLSGNNAVAVGTKGAIFKSTDAGLTWTKQTAPTNLNLNAVCLLNCGCCWIAGDSGYTARYTNMVTGIEDHINIPATFSLHQNYPNPFNPQTTISYALPTYSHVQLTIYNQLGQLITTLVNTEQNTGQHSIDWSPTFLASGTYFYRLQVNNNVITKKMTYLK